MTGPLYAKLSDDAWDAAWPSSGPAVDGRSVVERAKSFGVDITLLLSNLRRSPEQRLLRAQRTAASLRILREEADRARTREA